MSPSDVVCQFEHVLTCNGEGGVVATKLQCRVGLPDLHDRNTGVFLSVPQSRGPPNYASNSQYDR